MQFATPELSYELQVIVFFNFHDNTNLAIRYFFLRSTSISNL